MEVPAGHAVRVLPRDLVAAREAGIMVDDLARRVPCDSDHIKCHPGACGWARVCTCTLC